LLREAVENREFTCGEDEMYFKLNPDAIIFLDSDSKEGYRTIAYDEKNDKMWEISPPLYFVLKALDSTGWISEEDFKNLIRNFSPNDNSIEKAIEDLISRGIIIRNEHPF
jgi:hypothetical protein